MTFAALNLLEFPLAKPEPGTYWWLEFPGEPIAKERVGWGRGRRSYNPNEQDEEDIRNQIIATFPQFARGDPDATHLWGIRCLFYCSRIESIQSSWHFRGKVLRSGKKYSRKRKGNDTDNMLKLVKDALNGFIWKDDSQVREDFVRAPFSDRPRTQLLFYHLGPDAAEVEP